MKAKYMIATAIAAMSLITGTQGAAATDLDHCVVRVVDDAGELRERSRSCFASLSEALADAGVVEPGTRVGSEDLEHYDGAALASGVIGVHWDGANRTGASITISGSACGGGWLNLSNDWINRISSTWNLCPTTRFYNGFNLTGSSETLGTSAVNLGALNNLSNSISYS